jgi:hypothetical protein
VPAHDCELVVVERARLREDLVRHRQLADVVQEPADRELAETGRGDAELLSHRHGEQRDPAGVAGGSAATAPAATAR